MSNKVAVMQPYIFPYIGYLNLVQSADNFVFYDDVNFIKKGWIHRNQIILMGEPYRFTIPLIGQSQNKLIKDIQISNLKIFKDKFINQLDASYKNSLYKNNVLDYVDDVLSSNSDNISDLAMLSVKNFFKIIGIEKNFFISSKNFSSSNSLGRADRLISITKEFKSNEYINAMGGMSIYSKAEFLNQGVSLKFVNPSIIPYSHCNVKSNEFNPGLSIIDIMMNVSKDKIRTYLDSYKLI